MKFWRMVLVVLAAFSLASCSSEPEYADPEAHEKTAELREQFAPLIVGTWHFEQTTDKERFFEQLTFQDDGTFTGVRKWQSRQLVTINNEQRYTDWESLQQLNGTFTGKWFLLWERDGDGEGHNMIFLRAEFDDDANTVLPYSHTALFDGVDATTLRFYGFWASNGSNLMTYQRGAAEPTF